MTKKIEKQVVTYAIVDTNEMGIYAYANTRESARQVKRELTKSFELSYKIIKLKGDEIVR